jgi:hypothetical protein
LFDPVNFEMPVWPADEGLEFLEEGRTGARYPKDSVLYQLLCCVSELRQIFRPGVVPTTVILAIWEAGYLVPCQPGQKTHETPYRWLGNGINL